MKQIAWKLFLIRMSTALLFVPKLFALETNFSVSVQLPADDVSFLGQFEAEFSLPENLTLISLSTNYDFSETSIDIEVESVETDGFTLWVTSYEITNFDFPSLTVSAFDGEATNEFLTPSFEVSVLSTNSSGSLLEETETYKIRSLAWIFKSLFGFLLVLLIAGGIFLWLKNRKEQEKMIPIDPYEEMKSAIEKLRHDFKMAGDEDFKELYSRASESSRRFLERAYGFNALELSTSEIRAALKKLEFPQNIFETTDYLLKSSDRVKYAKHKPAAKSFEEVLSVMKELSEECRLWEEEKERELSGEKK